MKTKIFSIISLLLIAGVLNATNWGEKNKIVASDRAENDNFGNSVDIDGNYAIVGAFRKDNYTGAAYIFKKNTSGNWVQVAKLIASDRAADDNFGYSVSISGNFAIVGAYQEDEDAIGGETVSNAGSVYIFKNDGSDNWIQVQKKVASNRSENNYFGYSVSMNGEYAVVGAYGRMESRGAAYVLKKGPSDAWSELQIIYSTDGSPYDCFGSSVSIDEITKTVIVGAKNEDEDAGGQNTLSSAGSAYVFKNDGSDNYSQTEKIVPNSSDRKDHSEFGNSISISGSYVIIGARTESHSGGSGAAYVFKNDGNGNWLQNSRIDAGSDSENNSFFGNSVSIDGDNIIIGAYGESDDASGSNYKASAGAAYIFKKDGNGNWTQDSKIVASDRASSDDFGFGVAISGDWAIAGAEYEDKDTLGNNIQSDAGSAYLFTNQTITEYFVATNGSDETGNGSSSSPWATVQKGVNAFADPSVANTVYIKSGTFTETVLIDRSFTNLTIKGNGAKNTIVQAASSANSAANRVFTVADGQTLAFENLTIRYGNTPANNHGGGISNGTGTIEIKNCALINNTADSFGGGIYNKGTAIITNSTFSGNTSGNCGGGYAGDNGTQDIITNCTFFNNSSNNGAGIFFNSFSTPATSYFVTNCTIANNATPSNSGEGGGIYVMGGTLSIKNSILANNQANGVNNDFYQNSTTIIDNGYNIVEVSGGYTFSANGDLTGTGLTINLSSTLDDNNTTTGTQTLKTTSGSVAINGGNSASNGSVAVPAKDQRGANRNGTTDIGAYEYYDDGGTTPVELTSFTAGIVYENVVLNWQTATEVDNYGFEVQRQNAKRNSDNVSLGTASPINGYDATSWKTIGFVPGHGNSNSPKKYSFCDQNTPSGKIQYRLKQIDSDGQFEYSEVIEITVNAPDKFKLYQNYPNPFSKGAGGNPSTIIRYQIPENGFVSIKIYNVLGREIKTLVNKKQEAGNYETHFNANDLGAGVYFYRLESGKFIDTKKMILLK